MAAEEGHRDGGERDSETKKLVMLLSTSDHSPNEEKEKSKMTDGKASADEPVVPQKPAPSNVKDYLLLLWDGLGFFGFDDTKLGRLTG